MIEAAFFCEEARRRGTGFFCGVPDSLLKHFCAYVADSAAATEHIVAVNEGAAVGLACGYHLATGKIPLVYLQNSGLGNAVNPLLSLCDAAVYRIPVLFLIGWRGEPAGGHDEPQHITQGRVQEALLNALELPHALLAREEQAVRAQLDAAFSHLTTHGSPYALVVQKDTFAPYMAHAPLAPEVATLSREDAIEVIITEGKRGDIFVSTTGMASRELYELREKHLPAGESRVRCHRRDFLTVGSMGHASQIACAVALHTPERTVTVLDGDGALLMHMGALAACGALGPRNLRHVVLNNHAHDSVGGQPTIAPHIDLCALARACGYTSAVRADSAAGLAAALAAARGSLAFIEARVKKGARAGLGRPAETPVENKVMFMEYIQGARDD